MAASMWNGFLTNKNSHHQTTYYPVFRDRSELKATAFSSFPPAFTVEGCSFYSFASLLSTGRRFFISTAASVWEDPDRLAFAFLPALSAFAFEGGSFYSLASRLSTGCRFFISTAVSVREDPERLACAFRPALVGVCRRGTLLIRARAVRVNARCLFLHRTRV